MDARRSTAAAARRILYFQSPDRTRRTAATSVTISEPVLTFWQSDRKCRLKGNLSGPMKTGVGPRGPHPMAVSEDSISGLAHVGRTIGIL